jgi:ubiquinone/menaquinone biosynthesis C-methylase UbiE
MSHFDDVARGWDNNPAHLDRSKAVARAMQSVLPSETGLKALEYGAGTAILSSLLKDLFSEITLMDSSSEMVKVMNEKVLTSGYSHLTPLLFDLEHNDYLEMVFHHVGNIDVLVQRLYKLINPGGQLLIADLFTENGTFHDSSFKGHNGFNPEELGKTLEKYQFKNVAYKQCFVERRQSPNGTVREYPMFLLTANK